MSTSRRVFLKSTLIAGAGMAMPAAHASAETSSAVADAPAGFTDAAAAPAGAGFTRGIGLYPGAAEENFAPELVIDATTYRNLALRRPAYHSSAYDYNLTAQLVTDGVKDTRLPSWVAVSMNRQGELPKPDRETLLNHYEASPQELKGASPSVQVMLGGDDLPEIDKLKVFLVMPKHVPASAIRLTISVSDDGRTWTEAASLEGPDPASPAPYPPDMSRGTNLFYPEIPLKQAYRSRYYEVKCSLAQGEEGAQWQMGQIEFWHGSERVQVGGPYSFTSAWMSAGSGEEWVYVDLGARCEFDRIALYWVARAAEGKIQLSDDAESWRDLQSLAASTNQVDDIHLPSPERARYVRVLMTQPTSAQGYLLSEIEVYGRGGLVAKPKAAQQPTPDGSLNLAGGAWRVERISATGSATGEALATAGYKDESWVVATVPGTVLTSYLNAGAIPDPNFGQNQLHISDSYFYSDFWHRTEFTAPVVAHGQTTWLNFDGINWKADVYLNGEKLGRIEGGFMRGQFDVTGKLKPGQANALAVKVEKNATPGACKQKTWENPSRNGGALGRDNPTYHASIGWDWIPTIRGRNSGIWGDVYLSVTGSVTVENPLVVSTLPLPDTSHADVKIEVELWNHSAKPVTGTLKGTFGAVKFAQHVDLAASERKAIRLDTTTHPELRIDKPELWWPAGYGEPHLYDVELNFEGRDHKVTDSKKFKAGIRQMTFSEEGGKLRLWINGRRFVARGGNWGFGESMLRYRAREYDAALRYHREMNFTMVRNWVGQIGDKAFWEACDRHGIVVWQDFWLANPWDGPIPDDNALFLKNARDYILRIRSHASIGLYCGRNEGYPPPVLDAGIRKLLAELHPDIHYIGSSADDVVSGHGPYNALPTAVYFDMADSRMHSEIGMPNIPPIESVRAMMPEKAIWPQGLDWGLHDFSQTGAQGGSSFLRIIEDSYGGAQSGEQWVELAQFVNYEGHRAMFEAQSKYRMGVLLWMSHPCWPSFVWQTYDYYFEPTAAYFGAKKGSEPLHIQWNRTTGKIEVVNYSGGSQSGLTAQAEIVNLDGAQKWSKTASLSSAEDSTETPIEIPAIDGLTSVHFLRLSLTQSGKEVSSNFYLRAINEGDYRAIRQLAKAQVRATTKTVQQGEVWTLTTELENTSQIPALMVRLKAVRERSGDRILPAIYSDNYIALMPGEKHTVTIELKHADTRGEAAKVVVSGFNVVEA
ncbi:glycosyl hydrolase 2 galactose-binding domain-containing protein [Silvibacterium dinghuense]|nr:discoidin domain-containing protein [Silvibacterium dinghuense]